MKSFSAFLKETVKATPRVGINHINAMKPADFIQLMNAFKKDMKGILNTTNASFNEKVDGSSLRFGLSPEGKFFFETSHSGPLFSKDGFSAMVLAKHPDADLSGPKKFDDLGGVIRSSKKIQAFLKKHNTENGIKIAGEIIFHPLGEVDGDKIRFIRISYDRKKLGTTLTFFPFDVLDGNGEKLDNQAEIISDLKKLSDPDIMILTNEAENVGSIDMNVEIDNLNKFVSKYNEIEKILVSRKKVDKEEKNIVKAFVKDIQDKVAAKILAGIKAGRFGPSFEGIVFTLATTGKTYKVVSQEFIDNKHLFKS